MNKKLIYGACALAIAATSFTSCSDEQNVLNGGEGQLYISTSVDNDVRVVSRAAADLTEDLSEKLIVWISSSKGSVVRKYNNDNTLPSTGISLVAGSYVAEAWTGDSVSAAWDKKYYKAREEFTITGGESTTVNMLCTVANSVVSVVYSDEVKEMLSDRTITVNHSRAELTFDDEHADSKAYFMMPTIEDENGNNVKESTLHWGLGGKRLNGTDVFKSGDITNVKPGYEYVLTVKYTEQDTDEIGGGMFSIEVNEEPLSTKENVISIYMAPQIEGFNDYEDLSQPIYAEKGAVGKKSIFASVTGTSFKSFAVESSILSTITGVTSIDLIGLSSAQLSKLESAGITYSTESSEENNYAWIKLNFSAALLNSLDEGEYDITVTATDQQDKSTTATMQLHVSDAALATNSVNAADIWATHAPVTATIINEEKLEKAAIKYRVAGTSTWSDAVVTVSGTTVSANLTGLTPGTTYEYVAANGSTVGSDIMTFTTEAATQLPNASFEQSYTASDGAICFSSDASSMFWDSGNHGSAKMSKNITTLSTEKVVDGTYSLKMSSQFVGLGSIGKFAAGNVFVGEFLTTVKTTNGVLGWGRTWTSRPAKLKGYLHYTPAAVEYTEYTGINKGDMDTGIIYIAILDESTNTYTYSGSTWTYPVIINTYTKELFSNTASNVIAYGEKVLTSATSGDAMVEFEIPLEYYRTDLKASNIMVTCSASRYGDYFTGGSSVLYIDKLELVYE